jgi:putative aminopeptidase FrvX
MNSSFLTSLLSIRTAPFREQFIRERLEQELSDHQVPHFLDGHGNIVVGAKNRAEYARMLKKGTTAQPTRFFIAHMDHPGFHVTEAHGSNWKIKWHGGTPTEFFEGAEVWLKSRNDARWEGRATLIQSKKTETGRSLDHGEVRLHSELPKDIRPTDLFGSFAFRAACWQDDEIIRANACDDLVGCYAIVEAAKKSFAKGKLKAGRAPFLALLSRAEEVGFIGTLAHLQLGWWKASKAKPLVVSLETSRQLPGAEIGKGPVVRTGDKFTAFSPGPMQALHELAQAVLPNEFQRRIMDGGTCEGSAATVFGLPVIALSVPLGNYHNQSFEDGPDSRGEKGPAPEFVHTKDVERLLKLVDAIATPKYRPDTAWKATLKAYLGGLKKYRALMKS